MHFLHQAATDQNHWTFSQTTLEVHESIPQFHMTLHPQVVLIQTHTPIKILHFLVKIPELKTRLGKTLGNLGEQCWKNNSNIWIFTWHYEVSKWSCHLSLWTNEVRNLYVLLSIFITYASLPLGCAGSKIGWRSREKYRLRNVQKSKHSLR